MTTAYPHTTKSPIGSATAQPTGGAAYGLRLLDFASSFLPAQSAALQAPAPFRQADVYAPAFTPAYADARGTTYGPAPVAAPQAAAAQQFQAAQAALDQALNELRRQQTARHGMPTVDPYTPPVVYAPTAPGAFMPPPPFAPPPPPPPPALLPPPPPPAPPAPPAPPPVTLSPPPAPPAPGPVDAPGRTPSNPQDAEKLKTLTPQELARLGATDKQAFFAALRPAAEEAERMYGVPASITLAQAALETGWGKHIIPGYNIFGIKGRGPAGTVAKGTWEVYNGRRVTITANFAKYNNFHEGVIAHGKLFHNGYYSKAMNQFKRDHDPYAFARNITGVYATDPQYGAKLTSIMRTYRLT